MSLTKSLLALAAFGCLGLCGKTAFAQTCTADADCPRGFSCQVSGVVSVTEPACPTGAKCATSGAGAATGTTATISTCEPAACVTDSDCGTDMVCYAQTSTSCSGSGGTPACPPDSAKCDPPAPPTKSDYTCTTTTTSSCAYKWQLPCNADADCGGGFVCQPTVTGVCSGGSATGSSGTGVGGDTAGVNIPVDVPPSSCTTTTSFPGYCQVQATTCAVDADCPASWKCIDAPSIPVPLPAPVEPVAGGTTGASGGAPTAVAGAGAGNVGGAAPDPTTTAGKVCASPYVPPGGFKSGGSGYGGEVGGTGTSGSDPTGAGGSVGISNGTGGVTGGAPPPAASSTGGTVETPVAGGPASGGGASGADTRSNGSVSPASSGGCSVNPERASSQTSHLVLALAGLGLVIRARRRSSRR